MRTIERQLGGLVTRKLGSGNAFGEFDNADGDDFSNAGGKARRQARRDARNARKSGGCDDVTKDTPLYGLSFCVKGAPIYPSLTTVATLADWKKKINRCICGKRKEANVKDDVAPETAVPDTENIVVGSNKPDKQLPLPDTSGNLNKSATITPAPATKGNKMLLIGGGLLLLVVGAVLFIRARKK